MVSSNQLQARRDEKLITEFPLKEGLAIYLDAWKQLFSSTVKSVIIGAFGVLVVGIASIFLTAAAVIGVASSIFTFLVIDHPILTVLVLVVFVFALLAVRAQAART
jgi:hypothetical protein